MTANFYQCEKTYRSGRHRKINLQSFFARSTVIGLLLLLGSCSMLRMSYNQGPQLVWWWLDGYVNFSSEQAPHVKEAIRQWFDWHRTTQLPEYAAWLSALRDQISDPVTPTQVCRWSEELRNTVAPALDHSLQLAAPLVLGLGETQWRHIEQHYAKGNDEFRRDHLQPRTEERLEASIKRTVKRAENLYGNIDKAQQRLIAASLEASPFDPEAWLVERQRRQREILLTLRQLASEPVETEHIVAALRTLIEHIERSADADYRTYQIKLTEYNCGFIARLHNSTSFIQRRHAYDKLKHWEADLRILAADTR
jgi:hypothetical protein